MDALAVLLLPVHGHFLILRSSLQPHLAHLACSVPWAQLHVPLGHLEQRIAHAFFGLMQQPHTPHLLKDLQLALLLWQAGFGLPRMSPLELPAARAIALAQHALRAGPQERMPFHTPARTWFLCRWTALCKLALGSIWLTEAHALTNHTIRVVLPYGTD
jgi:hypothetical protein